MEGPAFPDSEETRSLSNFEHRYSPGELGLASVSISETFQNARYCMGVLDDETVGHVQHENMNVHVI